MAARSGLTDQLNLCIFSSLKKLLFLIPVCIMLYACPYESTVPLEPRPIELVDTSLLGYWYGIVKDGSDFFGIEALDITQKTDSTYAITRYGKAAKGDIILPDTSYFTGYTSYIGDQRFMNVEGTVVMVNTRGGKAPQVTTQKVFYIAAFDRKQDTLSTKTVTEYFSTSRKGYHTCEDLKKAIADHIGLKKNIYDDLYALSYKRTLRPKRF
jgi:hypothetical protein